MVDDAASTPGSTPSTPAPYGLMETARRVLGQVAARVPGFDGGAAQRNAWEAVCADLQRRQQWNDVVDLAVNVTRRPTRRRASTARRAPVASQVKSEARTRAQSPGQP
ncbi:hypothetical protein [Actinopolymorpha alba]|uniref:hypothetical protein n=1 Tax=Actinopolymorpha alba TaxID=533267 RepID=UPI00037BE40B|nr:hypothetical protein [Actinopolymorpha alba]